MEGVACKRSKGLVDIRCDTWRSVRAPTGGGQLGVGCSAAVRVATPPCWRRLARGVRVSTPLGLCVSAGVPCHRRTFRAAWDSYLILTSRAVRGTFQKSQEVTYGSFLS